MKQNRSYVRGGDENAPLLQVTVAAFVFEFANPKAVVLRVMVAAVAFESGNLEARKSSIRMGSSLYLQMVTS
jgi:hypothetical protein